MKNFLKKLTNARTIFIFLGVLLIFFIALRPPTDPDMGWHIRDGQYLLENDLHVAKKDMFSYTMPNFPLIMHEWVTDVLMAEIYQKTNLFMLSVIFALIVTGAFLLVSWGVEAKIEYKIISSILGVIASIPVLGVRPQMLNLLGLALVVFIILKFRKNNQSKIIYVLPLIFLVWVNMHGGFAVGLFLLGVFIGLEIFKLTLAIILKKFFKNGRVLKAEKWLRENSISGNKIIPLISVFLISSLATLFNPYGWRTYIEIFNTIFDSYAKTNINEWMPVVMTNPMSYQFIIYLLLLSILLIFSFRRVDYTYLLICVVFLYLGFSSWRHMPLFLVISTPLWISIVESLVGRELSVIVQKKTFLIFLILAIFFVGKQRLGREIPLSFSLEKLAVDGQYPLAATRYLKGNPIDGRMFNEYNWGGFLIWQYPEKKVFIDGRMPSWKMGDQKIFEDFNKVLMFNDGWQDILKKYDIGFALVYNNPPNKYVFLNLGWREVYSDELACIFVRPDNQ